MVLELRAAKDACIPIGTSVFISTYEIPSIESWKDFGIARVVAFKVVRTSLRKSP
jgi:hypothetical protein